MKIPDFKFAKQALNAKSVGTSESEAQIRRDSAGQEERQKNALRI